MFVGPGATLEIRDARVRVASEDGAETAWASVARLAPGANLRARARDDVVFETLPTAFGDGRGDDRDRVETIVRARRRRPFHSIVSIAEPLRAYFPCRFARQRPRTCVVGGVRDASSRDSEGTGNVGSRPIPTSESPDAVHLTLGVAMEATVETDDATRETDVQARLVRVCAETAGGDVVSPADVTARYVSREDTLGNPTEDARITVGRRPCRSR